ncbi:MAG: phage integrase SAM-like domain-containing protein [Cytophagaceae bacterium]|nr:phage integrase SAM-like domain-containing protein [Cytophagaceae bacterium]
MNSGYSLQRKIKANLVDYYYEFIRLNRKVGNRHLETSLDAFKNFIKNDCISLSDITENLCEGFRDYLLKKFNGETPANNFMRFKRVLQAIKKDGYFRNNSAEDVVAKAKKTNT